MHIDYLSGGRLGNFLQQVISRDKAAIHVCGELSSKRTRWLQQQEEGLRQEWARLGEEQARREAEAKAARERERAERERADAEAKAEEASWMAWREENPDE
jgi:hypothetical protein